MVRSFSLNIHIFETPGLTEYFDGSIVIANGLPATIKVLERVTDSGIKVPPEVSLTVRLCSESYGAQILALISPGSTSISARFHPGSVLAKAKTILLTTGFVRIFESGDPVEEWVWLP